MASQPPLSLTDDDPRRVAGGHACSVIIVTYQSANHIGALLEALGHERDDGLDVEALVVDNSSSDATASIVGEHEWVTFIPSGGNLGYAAAINIGVRQTEPDRPVFILNPDLVLTPGALRTMLSALDSPNLGAVVPQIHDADGALYPSLRNEPTIARAVVDAALGRLAEKLPSTLSGVIWDPRAYQQDRAVDWATGAALLLDRRCLESVGDWDESFFLYSEETDYCHRLREAGWQVGYLPSAVVHHEGGGSGASDGLYALMVVNSVRYFAKHHGRVATSGYSAAVTLHQLLRAHRPAQRLALRALVSRRVRRSLPGAQVAARAADRPPHRGRPIHAPSSADGPPPTTKRQG
jgi:GT2 family glycosyltransferase